MKEEPHRDAIDMLADISLLPAGKLNGKTVYSRDIRLLNEEETEIVFHLFALQWIRE